MSAEITPGTFGFNLPTFFQCAMSGILFREVYASFSRCSGSWVSRALTFAIRFIVYITLEVFLFFVCTYFRLSCPLWFYIILVSPYILHALGLFQEVLESLSFASFWTAFIPLLNPMSSCFFGFLHPFNTFQLTAEEEGFTAYLYMAFVLGVMILPSIVMAQIIDTFFFSVDPENHRWRILIQRMFYFTLLFASGRFDFIRF